MQHPYSLDSLTPLSVRVDEDGDTHAVYCLPASKRWPFRVFLFGSDFNPTETEQVVSKVRVCLSIRPSTNQPMAVVVPFGPDDEEDVINTVVFRDVVSIVGVLAQLGFTLTLPTN